jgi:DNA-binding NarL/FixJ family response regulator
VVFGAGVTVRNHVSNVFAKLRMLDRSQAIIRAREAGLGPQQPD